MIIDKGLLAQAAGVFAFMVSEAVLGRTRFRSWLGLAKALVWFIVRTILEGVGKLRPSKTQRRTVMSGTHNISQLKEVVVLLIQGVNAQQEAMADGSLSYTDAGLIFKVLPSVAPAIEGIDQVPAELADLQSDEVDELCALVASDLQLGDALAKKKVLAVIKWASCTVETVGALLEKAPVSEPEAAPVA